MAATPTELLETRITAELPSLRAGTTRFGRSRRRAWFAGDREIAHLHAGEVLDVRIPGAAQIAWHDDPRTTPRARRSPWLEFTLSGPDDVDDALALVRRALELADGAT